MALTYTIDFSNTAAGGGTSVTSGALTVATGDFMTVAVSYGDNGASTAWTVSNTGTAITWTNQAETNVASNNKVVLFTATAGATPPTSVTVTTTAGNDTNGTKYMTTVAHTGAHASNPLPSGNIFTGTGARNVSQSITPTASGSALWGLFGDWQATNSFVAIANNTLANTYHESGQQTATAIRPTTQPRTDAAAFTLGETAGAACKAAYIIWEVQAAAGGGGGGGGGAPSDLALLMML